MNPETLTSLEFSKKLKEAGCDLESDYIWWQDVKSIWHIVSRGYPPHLKNTFPAYDILNDICVKHAKKFFGEGEHKHCSVCKSKGDGGAMFTSSPKCKCVLEVGYAVHAEAIFHMVRQGRKKEAEDYIWEHCLFNKSK